MRLNLTGAVGVLYGKVEYRREKYGHRVPDCFAKTAYYVQPFGCRQGIDRVLSKVKPRPRVFIIGSAVGYYDPHGDEELIEASPPGHDFLAEVCRTWEQEANRARELGVRVVAVSVDVDYHGKTFEYIRSQKGNHRRPHTGHFLFSPP